MCGQLWFSDFITTAMVRGKAGMCPNGGGRAVTSNVVAMNRGVCMVMTWLWFRELLKQGLIVKLLIYAEKRVFLYVPPSSNRKNDYLILHTNYKFTRVGLQQVRVSDED